MWRENSPGANLFWKWGNLGEQLIITKFKSCDNTMLWAWGSIWTRICIIGLLNSASQSLNKGIISSNTHTSRTEILNDELILNTFVFYVNYQSKWKSCEFIMVWQLSYSGYYSWEFKIISEMTDLRREFRILWYQMIMIMFFPKNSSQ